MFGAVGDHATEEALFDDVLEASAEEGLLLFLVAELGRVDGGDGVGVGVELAGVAGWGTSVAHG